MNDELLLFHANSFFFHCCGEHCVYLPISAAIENIAIDTTHIHIFTSPTQTETNVITCCKKRPNKNRWKKGMNDREIWLACV